MASWDESGHVWQSVVFIGYEQSGTRKFGGTAFLAAVPVIAGHAVPYIITTAHTLRMIRDRTSDGIVYVRANRKDQSGVEMIPVPLDLWVTHQDIRVDVALAPVGIEFFEQFDAFALDAERTFETRPFEGPFQWLRPGTEIWMVGLFTEHYGQQLNVPITRKGVIASCPRERVKTKLGMAHMYLADLTSIAGHSGSPVFGYHSTGIERILPTREMAPYTAQRDAEMYLIGMMQGHWREASDPTIHNDAGFDPTEDVEWDLDRERRHTGISLIVPADQIVETLNLHPLVATREREREGLRLDLNVR